ncbi:hypothetical protein LCGC14_1164000 [marine sediment metagenome]|uniref:UDP-N-acetylglucosamine 2-epimerase domain-containing protein n=1 Tax=marine sediment metagenome TaxID=412755 RepID=A0A0F9LRS8_9ZZZZ
MIYIVAGARPNFMKVAPLIKQMKKKGIKFKFIHTGQHYDFRMSKIFFRDLEIPEPDIHLNVKSGSHATQTAKIMISFEEHLLKDKPSLVIVVGDVNSTLACSLTAKKMGIKVAHIEAGLRSFDMTMPEEINRILTDHISDYLFVSEESGMVNLNAEGIKNNVFFVGNIMIENLINNLEKIKNQSFLFLEDEKGRTYAFISNTRKYVNSKDDKMYALITFHRPTNVDNKKDLENIINILKFVKDQIHVIFVIHPRTEASIVKHNLRDEFNMDNVQLLDSMGYLEFLDLMVNAKLIITDSGGIQEEASYLKVPVLTARKTTERPITITEGTNTITGINIRLIKKYVNDILLGNYKKGQDIKKWDNLVSKRIIKILKEELK